MECTKYLINKFDILTKQKTINYQNTKLKTINLINIIDMFLQYYTFFNKDNIKLNSRILKQLYTSQYVLYLNYLIDNNFIILWKNYSVGYKSKTFKLHPSIKKYKIYSINIDIPDKLYNKIKLINITTNSNIDEWIKDKLIDDLYKIDIDIDGAINWLNNNIIDEKVKLINLTTCNKIYNKDIYYSFDNYGRFHTNFTVLKKQIRNNFLKINNFNIKEIDIINSQPFFLYILMKKYGFQDFEGFDIDVLNGKIYDKIASISGKTRNEVKPNIYSVLFGKNITKTFWNILFDNLYPNVYKWIKEYKSKNKSYKIIAQELQFIESDFIFNNLIPNILLYDAKLPIITIHDSIIIPAYSYNTVLTIFNNTKQQLLNSELKLKKYSRIYN